MTRCVTCVRTPRSTWCRTRMLPCRGCCTSGRSSRSSRVLRKFEQSRSLDANRSTATAGTGKRETERAGRGGEREREGEWHCGSQFPFPFPFPFPAVLVSPFPVPNSRPCSFPSHGSRPTGNQYHPHVVHGRRAESRVR